MQQVLGFVKAGRLAPGHKLPSERELADRFGVSRPTVREAMRALAALGVVEIRHGDGVFVTALKASDLLAPLTFFLSLSEASVRKLYEARILIEGEIGALAAGNCDDRLCDELAGMIAVQMQVRHSVEAYLAADTEFHARIAAAADNPFLAAAAQSLNVIGLEFRRAAVESADGPSRSIEDHRRILAALRARDPEAARAAMQAHMRQVFETTEEVLRATAEAKRGGSAG